MSALLLRFKANYLEKNVGYPKCFFVVTNSPYKDLLFPPGPNLAQIPLYLVGTAPLSWFKLCYSTYLPDNIL